MNRDATIFVAGHRGLVGSAIVHKLHQNGYDKILVRTRDELDLTNAHRVENFFKTYEIEYVFLAAAKVGGIIANSTQQGDFIYENLAISMNIIKSAKDYGVRKLLNLGSSCIYPRQAPQPIRESDLLTGPLEPTNEGYAISKIAALKMCRYFNEQYGTDFMSVMPTNLYGPGDSYDLSYSHVLPAMIRKFHLGKLLSQGNQEGIKADMERWGNVLSSLEDLSRFGITADKITLWGSGQPRREFLYIDDLADACVMLMEKYQAADIGEAVNVGCGQDIAISSLAETIKEIVGFEGKIDWDITKPDGMPRKLLDVSKITRLGWRPSVDLSDGIRRSYRWYLEESST